MVSDSEGVFYTYLIRSIVVDGELVVGPRKSLNAIREKTGLSYAELEHIEVELIERKTSFEVFSTPRIGLGKTPSSGRFNYREAELRFLLCDEYFKKKDAKKVGYPQRTYAIDTYLKRQLENRTFTKEEAIDFSSRWYGAVSKWLKEWKEDDV